MVTENEMFLFLDDLRNSGTINMFSASSYLMRTFDIPPTRAAQTLDAWLKTYKHRHPEAK